MENGRPLDIDAMLPEAMAELMKDFIAKKDFESRLSVRCRMKALLDYAAADTEYPPNPLLKKEEAPDPARNAVMQQGIAYQTPNVGCISMPVAAIPEPVPVPGARRIDNSELLG